MRPFGDVAEEAVSDEGVGPEGFKGASGAVDGGARHRLGLLGLHDVSVVGHVETAPQRGVVRGKPAPRAAHQPGAREEVGQIQLPEHRGERVRRHLGPVAALHLVLLHGCGDEAES